MDQPVSVVIPLERGASLVEHADAFPEGTRVLIAEHDPGEQVKAINVAVREADTEFVLLSGQDVVWNTDALDFLGGVAWDSPLPGDVVYGSGLLMKDGKPEAWRHAEHFCPNRLDVENHVPPYLLVRRQAFLDAGGLKSGKWALWRAMRDQGCRFKEAPEAVFQCRSLPDDPSPPSTAPDLKATFYYQATPGVAYWRCQLPARYLPGQAVFNYPEGEIPEGLTEKDGRVMFPNHRGAVVFQFAGDAAHQVLIRYFQRVLGVRVLLEVDDNYLQTQPNMARTGWNKRAVPGAFSIEQHRRAAAEVDGVIVTTEHLAKQYRKVNATVFVCGNQIDPSDWPALEKPDDGIFRVGWFGSGSHNGDAPLVERACEWAASKPDVEVVMIGVGVGKNGRWFRRRFPFKHVPWTPDFGVYRKILQQLDVGLAPVVGTPWALCRSDLKLLEYLMAGVYPVVSDHFPYSGWAHGDHCLKASDAKGFLRAVQDLYARRNQVRELALEGRRHVLATRTMQGNVSDWEDAISNGSD